MILTTLSERRREMAILRSVGASPAAIFGLLLAEAALLTLSGVVLGVMLLYGALLLVQPFTDRVYGLHIPVSLPTGDQVKMLFAVAAAGLAVGVLPALRAYRQALADGMKVRT